MQAKIETFFAGDVSTFTDKLAHLDARVDPSAEARRDHCFHELTEAVCRSQQACRRLESLLDGNGEQVKEVQDRFREEIASWFDRSWFMHRAQTKPRGYPGDYELLAAIYDGVPKSSGLGGYLDLYFLNTTLGRAVPARLQAARSFLVEEVSRRRGDVSILNVACGPCREFVGGFEHPEECTIHVTCIDNDRQALEYVSAHVRTIATGIPDINCACYNALKMKSPRANIKRFGRCDILYSVGLCDYIPDRYLVSMLQGWRESLNDGGVLYVAFKDATRYDKTQYQWLVDWFFLQRTEEDCRALFRQAGFDMDGLEMTRDATSVIMNFIGRVKRPTAVRVDLPGEQRRERPRAVPTARRQDAAEKQIR